MASFETSPRGKGLSMSPLEKRAVAGLSFIYVARMLGLFMLMPVLALDNDQLRYSATACDLTSEQHRIKVGGCLYAIKW